MILSDIIKAKREHIERSKKKLTLEYIKHRLSRKNIVRRNFKHAISQSNNISIIAEIKKASPTRGLIREDFDVKKIAREYQINGAAAISVLTEEDFFKGRLSYIKLAKKATNLPILRKDFIIDEYQVYESALAGADAILLITDILSKEEIVKLSNIAKLFNMAVLCESHSKEQLEKAISAKQEIIGINNRDLSTFKLSISTTENLVRLIPENKVIVSESGIRSYSDVLFLKSIGVNAALVGEVLMEAEDVGKKLNEFTNVR